MMPKSWQVLVPAAAFLFCLSAANAQAPFAARPVPPAAQPLTTTAESIDFDQLTLQGKALLEKARQGSGSAGAPLSRYPHSFTQLAVRVVDGGGEEHRNFADFLFVIDGEGTELTGGRLVNPKEGANGEVRGTRLEGATAHPLHKGIMIHVPAGQPHQQLVAKGKGLVVYVIKVEEQAPAEQIATAIQ